MTSPAPKTASLLCLLLVSLLPSLSAAKQSAANTQSAASGKSGQSTPTASGDAATPAKTAGQQEQLVVLIGDSTVTDKHAKNDEAGWGWALQSRALPGTTVANTALGGRSSRSFRNEGHWDKAIALQPDWVLIQFGHNDQKGKGPGRESDAAGAYRDHLRGYIAQARAAGAQPVLITPVCRRTYNAEGALIDTLAEYAEAVRIVGQETQVPVLDLHQYSYDQLSKLTDAQSRATFSPTHNLRDRTHFSTAGSQIVADWVLTLMQQEAPALAARFQPTAPDASPRATQD